jgi:ubiquinone/menaquinone biosynthesis C-methylase UbiE
MVISGRADLQQAYRDDTVARNYVANRFMTPLGRLLHDSQVEVVREIIGRHRPRAVAEIAPGPARVTVDIAPGLDKLTIMDASLQMLGEARRRLTSAGTERGVRLVQADAFRLPTLGQHDLVYSFRLIRHFERADRLRLYSEINSILRPGGYLVFDAVNERVSRPLREHAAPGEYKHHDAMLRPNEIRQELGESGFDLVSLVGVQHHYNALVACQVYVAPRADRLARALIRVIDRMGGEPLEWVVVCRRR